MRVFKGVYIKVDKVLSGYSVFLMDFVIDTSSLIAFSGIRRLDLLHDCCGTLAIPIGVRFEVVDQGGGWVEALDAQNAIEQAEWLKTFEIPENQELSELRRRFGNGESECILLAQRFEVPFIVDDQGARREAERRGLATIGSLGILARCHRRYLIGELAPLINEMRNNGIRFSDKLVAHVLSEFDGY